MRVMSTSSTYRKSGVHNDDSAVEEAVPNTIASCFLFPVSLSLDLT